MVTFTPSFSIFITCDTEEEFNTLYQKLIDGGHALIDKSQRPNLKRLQKK